MRSLILTLLLAAAGCAGRGTVAYHGTAHADVYGPDLVYVSPGVQVIADYNEPIFYADSYYWRYYGGRWYRSSYYTGGWVYAAPPRVIARIDRPYAYVRYRPSGYVSRRDRPVYRDNRPVRRDNRPVIRDHRTYRGHDATPSPQPVVRDHRTYTRPAPGQVQRAHPVAPRRASPVDDRRPRDNRRDRDRDRDDDRVRDHRR